MLMLDLRLSVLYYNNVILILNNFKVSVIVYYIGMSMYLDIINGVLQCISQHFSLAFNYFGVNFEILY